MSRYGLPYKGSKNSIAEWVVEQLPSAECFFDLFCGGGAITHAAMLSGKYKKFVMNDIDGRLPVLFKECAYGKYTLDNHKEWVSRDCFNEKKYDDAYIALIWSFGNNGKDYLYGKEIEQFKHDYHQLVFYGYTDLMNKYGFKILKSNNPYPYERYLCYQKQLKNQIPTIQLEVVTRQIEVERLQSLQSLQSLERLQSHYKKVKISDNPVVYCDIPYNSTNCGKYSGFDHNEFYDWAESIDNIFISEYWMPDTFVEIASIEKTVLSSASGNGIKSTEKLFTNKKTLKHFTPQKQLSFFD